MRMYDLIVKKRNGGVLSKEEIEYFVKGYTDGDIPDYQASALLMAIYFNSLSYEETLNLTLAMANSGDLLDLSRINGIKVDKHSTGGIGDKTSLIVGPLVSALGAKMAKMSGRGLGFTGGTIDKLESIPEFSTSLSEEQFINNVNKIGMAITGQTGNLDPADKKLYALRDVTATVDISPLIASSIMSKKLAAGADVIVLDVKTGSGAFMKEEKDAFQLADMMVTIGNGAGRKTVAIVSDMDEPLGNAIGNALEVKEAIETLNGQGAKDLTKLCIILASHMVYQAGITSTLEEANDKLTELIKNKSALNKFAEFVKAQGGDASIVYNTDLLPKASIIYELKATNTGYIKHIQSDELGNALVILGGGRQVKGEAIDHAVGIVLNKKVGDFVNAGDTIAFIHANDNDKLKEAIKRVVNAYEYSDIEVKRNKLIKGVLS
jgi:pyrimidine-nucleoside phosphorylase